MAGKIRAWRKELDALAAGTGITLEQVCEYICVHYPGRIGFYHKIPRKRETFIGIGMAFGQSLTVINDWIARYGEKRKLYAKEALSDLIWIYLINCNEKNFRNTGDHRINFFHMYDKCREKVQETYIEVWDEYVAHDKGTATVENGLKDIPYNEEFADLRGFVIENMDAFKTAYRKPRNMLSEYVQAILSTYTRANDGKEPPINFLRGYLDDSMMNYITGSPESINVIDMKSRDRVIHSKAVPKLKRTHIALCLALGMTADEINSYLTLMGYQELDPESEEESQLLESLQIWEEKHPLASRFKAIYLLKTSDEHLSVNEELQAVSDMLMLRSDLDHEYRLAGWVFPYMKE